LANVTVAVLRKFIQSGLTEIVFWDSRVRGTELAVWNGVDDERLAVNKAGVQT